jgi:hypothetical protein
LRKFYNFKKQARERRKVELLNKKFRELICSKERKKLNSPKKKKESTCVYR